MTKSQIEKWLIDYNPSGYTEEGFAHFCLFCDLIFQKILNPKIKECSFVEAVVKGDWIKAEAIGDFRNKDALRNGLYQAFVKWVKTTSEYITKNREDKLKVLGI